MGKYNNELSFETENTTYGKILKQIKPETNILEFGPAEGALTQYLHDELHCHVYIVEIDEDSFRKAVLYAEDGICGDIETYEWESRFADVSYDCILFADVLEHLRAPEEVLKRAGKLLKDNGKIMVSLPNIAHNDVLLNLYDNMFRYTDIGLLDNTHIRFFAYRNLNDLFAKAGLAIIKEDYTQVQTFHSEQTVENQNFGGFVEETFFARPCGEIFQFVLTAQKKQYVDEQGIIPERPIQEMMDASPVREQPNYYLEVRNFLQEVKNKDGHIEFLLQSERDLKTAIIKAEQSHTEQMATQERCHAEWMAAQERSHAEQMIAQEHSHAERMAAQERSHAEQMIAQEHSHAEQMAVLKQECNEQLAACEQKYAEQMAAREQEYTEQLAAREQEYATSVAALQQTLCNKEGHIALLLEADRELERIRNSRSWRFMGYAWKMRDVLVPQGSKRRLAGKMLIKFVKHPVRFLKKCSPTRVKKFFKTLEREGVEGTSRRLDDALIGSEIVASEVKIETLPNVPQKTAADYAPLFVPQWEAPAVSIVIPVYNQFDYTYLCVNSILEHSGDVSYEILIADDCSTDLTTQIDEIIHGLHTIHNKKNLRFLLNCNNAAKYAKGRYILFLNNDTQVQENWLAPLVELIERDESVGMVGSKLIYPDGRLQEAGGILWKDGSAWNFGHRSDPDAPEYNYVKETDYISGAAIMIHKSLWEEIGGFDETFVPAYCEDTDLAFEVRRRGYKVLYQPLSVVVHFEGVSNGTDLNSGQKAYQVVNQKKFFEKWKDVLEWDHFPNAENVFCARDKSRYKKTVLVIDHYIPTYDKDAGSRTVDQYLRLLVDMGYNVKLLGDNFYHDVPYARRYEQWGIEVLYGVYYRDHWKNWAIENRDHLDFVFMNRPHISIKYIDFFKKHTDAKIIYYGHDLHFLRESREHELTKDPALLESAAKWKKQELSIMEKADVVFTLSEDERAIINKELGQEKAVISPIFYYNSFPEGHVDLSGKKNIIFVGGFGHRPNEDGVLWFVDNIWEQVHAAQPESRLVIIGSKPTEKIQKLQSDCIKVTGYVSDEELEKYYQNCRLCIIPLRYGAGVKGKTIEAMYHRVPIVSTSIGIEGLPGIEAYVQPTDDAQTFQERVSELYCDQDLAEMEAEAYCQYIREHFSYKSAQELFEYVFSKEGLR